MPRPSTFRARSILSVALAVASSSCSTIRPRQRGPLVKACFVQQARGGIECALKNKTTVFLRWQDIQGTFLAGFDDNVIVPREDFLAIIERMHNK